MKSFELLHLISYFLDTLKNHELNHIINFFKYQPLNNRMIKFLSNDDITLNCNNFNINCSCHEGFDEKTNSFYYYCPFVFIHTPPESFTKHRRYFNRV